MNILDGLNPEQKEAVEYKDGPLLLLAGAGSGKTRVLTHRIAYLIEHYDINPWHILALTFTNKAAKEMQERVEKIVENGFEYIWVSTFHSTCVRILRRHIETLGYSRNFTIYDADDQKSLMKEVCKYLNIDTKQHKERSILSAISSAKDECITPEEYRIRHEGDYVKELYASAYIEYQKRLKSNNALDFDDLINKTIELLQTDAEVLRYYQNRFRYILVDEYQDTNTAQFLLISLLADGTEEDGSKRHNLCVVGDDDQSIYKFRGANISNILNFEKLYPDAKVIKLEQNYRSTQTILDAANHVIRHNVNRKDKALWSNRPKGEPLSYTQFETEYDEAEGITDTIRAMVENQGHNYRDFAILYRTNAQSRVFEEKLVTKSIPYKIVGAVNFYQRKEIKDILAYLRTIDNGSDDISVRRIINVPRRGIGLTTIDKINAYAQAHSISFYDALADHDYIDGLSRSSAKLTSFLSIIELLRQKQAAKRCTLTELLEELLEMTAYVHTLEAEDSEEANGRIENIEEFKSKIAAYEESTEEPTLSGFLEDVALVADIDNVEANDNMVLLMTLHSAKGLEFPTVFISGMEDGIFPGYMSIMDEEDGGDEMEEERRLCYVGITRAMDHLYLSAARSRHKNGEMQFNRPSRFLEEIPRFLISAGVSDSFQPHRLYASPSAKSVFANKSTSTTGKKGVNLFAGNSMIQKGAGGLKSQAVKPAYTKKPVPDKGPVTYTVGDKVKHQRFGEGTVMSLTDRGTDKEVTVLFDGGMERKMLASFAKLKKLVENGYDM